MLYLLSVLTRRFLNRLQFITSADLSTAFSLPSSSLLNLFLLHLPISPLATKCIVAFSKKKKDVLTRAIGDDVRIPLQVRTGPSNCIIYDMI